MGVPREQIDWGISRNTKRYMKRALRRRERREGKQNFEVNPKRNYMGYTG